MAEFFAYTNSFAAPFFSDSGTRFVEAGSASEAIRRVVAEYKHPAGLYFAAVFASADAYHKNAKPLATWTCNHELARRALTKDLGSYSMAGHGPGRFEINGTTHRVADPEGGEFSDVAPQGEERGT